MANEFLPFATAGGANVVTQAAYDALAARLAGFIAGTAASNQVNKALRQASTIAAVIGEVISDYSGFDALDNGDVATLETHFIDALLAIVSGSVPGQATLWHFGRDTSGTPNTLTVNVTPAISAYAEPLFVGIIPANTNTGASTLNLGGHGAAAIKRTDASALQPADIKSNNFMILCYDATAVCFRIISSIPLLETSLIHIGDDISGVANTIVANVVPPITSYQRGDQFSIHLNNTITGPTTINIGGLGAVSLTRGNGAPLQTGDGYVNQQLMMSYSGSQMQIGVTPSALAESAFVHSGLDVGTPNAIICNVLPAITAYAYGQLFMIQTHTNTSSTTANINGLGVKNVVLNTSGAALIGGELSSIGNHVAMFYYDGFNMRLINPVPRGVATTAVYIASGTFTPQASLVFVRMWAGGAAGRNVSGSSYSAGQGGGAGEYREGYFQVVPGTPITVTVGNGATQGSNGSGGDSSFGAYMVAKGGISTTGGNGGSGGIGFNGENGKTGYTNGNVTGAIIVIGTGGNAAFSGLFGGGGGGGDGGPSGNPSGRAGQKGQVIVQEIS
jgi:hypothetical protein